MLHDVAAGMSYLHARSYMHGDLRTPNVFVASDGRAKIGDFGFARLLGGCIVYTV
jgi:serine/threonine protein kinase